MRRFHRRFRIAAPLEEVAAFHRRATSLKAVTPPLIPMFFKDLPEEVGPGREMAFTLWMGPVPVRWRAALEALPESGLKADAESGAGDEGFLDRQLEGPFESWEHCHRFRAGETPGETWVIDEIAARLPSFFRHPLRFTVALKMWLGLPVLFAYRRWKTRRLLES
jgi:ligand-binding SRPBCC domain-containing protein